MRWIRSIHLVAAGFDQASKPDIEIDDVFQITLELIEKHHIKHIIFDIDQTLVPQGETLPAEKVINHLKFLDSCLEGTICFLTNEPNEKRSQALRQSTGFSVVSGNWRKPEPDAFTNALSYLGVNASKQVAMVGDRRWTDVLGANKAGLLSILVNPISPSLDKFGASLARSAEMYSAKASKIEYFAFLGSIASITGLNVLSVVLFLTGNISGSWNEYLSYLSLYRAWWIVAFLAFSALYFRFVSIARSKIVSLNANLITDYFNTYPLALRFFASIGILFLIALNWLGNDRLVQVGLIFCLFTALSLAASLFPFYHNQSMRVLRIGVDIFLVFVMASSLDGYYKFVALAYLSIPIATSSRHMGLPFNASIVAISICILLYVLSTFEKAPTNPLLISEQAYYMIVFVFVGIYVMTALTIRLEYSEITTPFSEISRHFENISQTDRLNNYLRGAAKSINCSGILIIKLFEGGVYYLSDNNVEYGRIPKTIAVEIGNFLKIHLEKLDSLNLSRQPGINTHSSIIRNIESLIRPPVRNGITAAVALRVPQAPEVFFIAINPLSRNGTIRSQFWIHHVAVIKVLALGVGVSLNGFIRDWDFRVSGSDSKS